MCVCVCVGGGANENIECKLSKVTNCETSHNLSTYKGSLYYYTNRKNLGDLCGWLCVCVCVGGGGGGVLGGGGANKDIEC